MAAELRHSRILGVGAYRPPRLVLNEEIAPGLGSSDQWIVSRSGIRSRHFAGPAEGLAEMAAAAAGKALSEAGIEAEKLALVVVASMSNLRQSPPLAVQVAHRLGAVAAGAVDLGAACAGFSYALSVASDAVRTRTADYVVVVGVERMTDIIDPADRSTAFLFGDGAGAVVVGPSREPGIGPAVWGADGSRADLIAHDNSYAALKQDPSTPWPTMRMQGQAVFRWAITELAPVGARALAAAGVAPTQIDAFVPHQANLRITHSLAVAMGLPDRVAIADDVVSSGNTSSASIPLAVERMLGTGAAQSGDLALLLGFGSGLVYAGQVVRLP